MTDSAPPQPTDTARARDLGRTAYVTNAPAAPTLDPEIRDMVSDMAVGDGAAAIFAAFTQGYTAAARVAQDAEIAAWLDEESIRWTPQEIAPSGRYGFTSPQPGVVQVVQLITRTGRWSPTPARYNTPDVTDLADGDERLAIDHGAGWVLSADDTRALGAFATRLGIIR